MGGWEFVNLNRIFQLLWVHIQEFNVFEDLLLLRKLGKRVTTVLQ